MTNSFRKNRSFNFKRFSVDDGQAGMPVSTDGVLLGAWAHLHNTHRLLDIGTGTGLLALMCAQRKPQAQITAIDIDPHAIQAAQYNVNQSEWASRIQLLMGDILTLPFAEQFDTIICNPPYFNTGKSAQQQQRAIARHTATLSHSALLQRCTELLTPQGRAHFILPIQEGTLFIQQAELTGWYLHRLCHVQPTPNKTAHRMLIELTLTASECQPDHLLIRDQFGYSPEFTALTRDFYLKM